MPKPTIGPMVLFIFQIILACSHLTHAGEDLAHKPFLLSKVLHFSGTGETVILMRWQCVSILHFLNKMCVNIQL